MAFLTTLAGIFGIEVEALSDQLRRSAIVNGSIALLVLIGLAFLLVAAYVALSAATDPLIAAVIIAGAAFLFALAVYLGSRIGARERVQRERERRRKGETTALIMTAAATAAPALLRSPLGKTLVPLAAVLAFMLLRDSKETNADE
jgi:drug/metabolite transporter (DMT)-like permease